MARTGRLLGTPSNSHAEPSVPIKEERSIFVNLIFGKCNILISSDKMFSSEKNDTNIIEIRVQ